MSDGMCWTCCGLDSSGPHDTWCPGYKLDAFRARLAEALALLKVKDKALARSHYPDKFDQYLCDCGQSLAVCESYAALSAKIKEEPKP